ncbi:MAG TPA: hypothetical protein VMV17_17835 [Streptosporangiaceae bacterium]|nr:hypothetical protein [Streptosporangiaceae bacterium]
MTEAFRLHELAAAKPGRRRRRKPQPVTIITVDSRVWAEVQRISGGDPTRIEIVSRVTVIVRDR